MPSLEKRNLIDLFVTEGVILKPEPVEEGVIELLEYVYLILDASLIGPAVTKTEPV
jgi:hypothetical protein